MSPVEIHMAPFQSVYLGCPHPREKPNGVIVLEIRSDGGKKLLNFIQ
jgi:hypothetical protein